MKTAEGSPKAKKPQTTITRKGLELVIEALKNDYNLIMAGSAEINDDPIYDIIHEVLAQLDPQDRKNPLELAAMFEHEALALSETDPIESPFLEELSRILRRMGRELPFLAL